jgi:hypothetical protein
MVPYADRLVQEQVDLALRKSQYPPPNPAGDRVNARPQDTAQAFGPDEGHSSDGQATS